MDEKAAIYHWTQVPPIPQGTKPLAHQVAGHVFGRDNGHKKNKIGFLQSDDGFILKPILGPQKGFREVEFYKMVHSPDCADDVLLGLRQFMPGYVGVWTTPEHPGMNYLKLEDVTAKFQKPCIMDIKVGPVTYDMEADAEKVKRERSKFPALEEVGFQVVGIKVYMPSTDSYKTVERTFLRALDKTTILTKGISQYFTINDSLDLDLVQAFLRQLLKIESWFLSQLKYKFIASSLLFIYDGKALSEYKTSVSPPDTKADQCDHNTKDNVQSAISLQNSKDGRKNSGVDQHFFDSIVDIRMIDFTHAFATSDGNDENYLIGLQSIIRYLSDLVQRRNISSENSS